MEPSKEKEKRTIEREKRREERRIGRKYKTIHIYTSWYASLDSFIFWHIVYF